MKINVKVLLLEVKNFLRARTVSISAIGVVLFGIYGLFHGSHVIGRQQKTIESVPTVQKKHLDQIVAHGRGKPAGTTAYYPFFYTFNPASPWARFAIGQRDVNPFTLKVKMLAIEGQLYDSDLTNPLTLLVGNLDVSFVFIFLFPLLIVAFTYNAISEEQENGVWHIVRSTAQNIRFAILNKLLIRLVILLSTALLLFIVSVLYLRLPFTYPTVQLGVVILLYVLFWFTVSLMVIALGKSSSFNATTLVSIWIFLCILFPGIANVVVNNSIPIPEASETAIKQREGYHEKWDMPKGPTMERFYAVYPQYRKYPIPDDRYSPGWYYAMQFSGDLESANSSETLFWKLGQRQILSEKIAIFDPVVTAQQLLNKIANTDLNSHVHYLKSVKEHHRLIREYFYPFIFEGTSTESINWAGYPAYEAISYSAESLLSGILCIGVWSILALIISYLLFQRNFIQIRENRNA